jgi:hypothetical protein
MTVVTCALRRRESVMELKVTRQCRQKFKFDVEPVKGRTPFR